MDNKRRHGNAVKPRKNYADAAREGKDTPREPRDIKQSGDKGAEAHMGAEEDQVRPIKPPTEELEEFIDKPGQPNSDDDEEYDPTDEITPG